MLYKKQETAKILVTENICRFSLVLYKPTSKFPDKAGQRNKNYTGSKMWCEESEDPSFT